MRQSGKIAGAILAELGKRIKPGMVTGELDRLAVSLMNETGCRSAFKGYHGYPANICVSVNDIVVHGIPGTRALKNGDLVSIDVGIVKDGYYGDTAATFTVGNIEAEAARLIQVTARSLAHAINKAREGNRLGDVSHAVQSFVEGEGFSVVRDFVGHGIGTQMHEEPQIPNFGSPHKGPLLKSGMVLAIEPMINCGTYKVVVDRDGWTVRTKDRKNSAHFEHTIAITENGPDILTK